MGTGSGECGSWLVLPTVMGMGQQQGWGVVVPPLCCGATQLHSQSCKRFNYYLTKFLAISLALALPGRLLRQGATSARAEDSSETFPKLPFWGSMPFPGHLLAFPTVQPQNFTDGS